MVKWNDSTFNYFVLSCSIVEIDNIGHCQQDLHVAMLSTITEQCFSIHMDQKSKTKKNVIDSLNHFNHISLRIVAVWSFQNLNVIHCVWWNCNWSNCIGWFLGMCKLRHEPKFEAIYHHQSPVTSIWCWTANVIFVFIFHFTTHTHTHAHSTSSPRKT